MNDIDEKSTVDMKEICGECGDERGEHDYDDTCPLYFKNGNIVKYSKNYRFKPAKNPYTFRVLSAGRIIQSLTEGGWIKDERGDYNHPVYPSFLADAFSFCGKKLPCDGSECYAWSPQWVEKVKE